jgi:hypothetical protein
MSEHEDRGATWSGLIGPGPAPADGQSGTPFGREAVSP